MTLSTMTYAEAVNKAMHEAMEMWPEVICYGLGVDDPKRIFGTTNKLVETFGEARVFDMPTAENGMLGVGIGAALHGLRPVMVHQRLDFFLLAMDQLVNSAAKWFYMFGGQRSVPITIRLMLGRGWGQGPTHSQNLHAWFAHIPGLKVVMPTSPADARNLLLASIQDPNPVIFLEHRWLHHQQGEVCDTPDIQPLGQARTRRTGSDVTIIGMSYQSVEALRAAAALEQQGIMAEVIDLCSIQPIDWDTLTSSVCKTGRLLVVDTGALTCSVSAEIVARLTSSCFNRLIAPPERIAMPDYPEPTSFGLTRDFYPDAMNIADTVHRMVTGESSKNLYSALRTNARHDVPGEFFKGPF